MTTPQGTLAWNAGAKRWRTALTRLVLALMIGGATAVSLAASWTIFDRELGTSPRLAETAALAAAANKRSATAHAPAARPALDAHAREAVRGG